jgi:hypothetical protein
VAGSGTANLAPGDFVLIPAAAGEPILSAADSTARVLVVRRHLET